MVHVTTKKYLIPLVIGSLLAVTGFVFVLLYIDPYTATPLAHFFFYLTLFLSTIGIFSLGSLVFRQKFFPGIYAELFRISIRQGILIAILITGLILLQSQNILHWWVGLTLTLLLIAIESFFSAN